MVVRPERPRSRRGGGEEREAEGSTPGPGRPDARFRWTASAGHEPASNQDGKRRWDHASCTTRSAAPRSPLSPPPVAEISSPFAQPHVADPHSSFSRSPSSPSFIFILSLLLSSLLCDGYYDLQNFDDVLSSFTLQIISYLHMWIFCSVIFDCL